MAYRKMQQKSSKKLYKQQIEQWRHLAKLTELFLAKKLMETTLKKAKNSAGKCTKIHPLTE